MRFFITLAIATTSHVAAASEILNLVVGQHYNLHLPSHETAHVEGQKFVSVDERDDSLEITGRAPGRAQIKIGGREIQIYVSPSGSMALFRALYDACRPLLGLNATITSDQVSIDGELHRITDWQVLAEVAQSFAHEYSFRAKIDEDIKPTALSFLRERLRAKNLPMPNIVFSPEVRALIAEEFRPMAALWDEALAPYGIARFYQKESLAIQPLIRVNIVVAEVNKAASQKLGIEWPDSTAAQISPNFQGPAQVMVTLHALERAGLGNILASPNLLARSGSEAEFLAGGELPIKVANHYIHDVVWKRHGIYLKIKPIADFSGKVSIELTTEVSFPDKVYDEIPSLKSNRMSTHFDLAEPRTIVLSGLIRNNWDENSEGLPFLSRLPILGRLFSSKSFTSSRSELVIFVTPQIVNAQEEPQSPPQLKNWKKLDDTN